MKQRNILIFSILLLFVIVLITVFNVIPNKKKEINLDSNLPDYDISFKTDEKKDFWNEQLEQKGGNEAYQNFSKMYRDIDYSTQHTDAHLFGELLYNAEGINGVKVCDSQFSFGCYHGFMIPAIATEGVDAVYELDKKCVEKWGKDDPICQHGIGHGLLSFLGYEELEQALEICSGLTWKNEIGGCSSGVFMEFNNPTPDHVNFSVREFKDAYFPCDSLDSQFQPACYFEQSLWWKRVFDGDVKKVGDLCEGILDQKLRSICFQGIGNAAPSMGLNPGKIREECMTITSLEGQIQCVKGASMHFKSEEVSILCQAFKDAQFNTCVKEIQR